MLLLSVLGLLLVGCGGDGDSPAPAEDTSAATTEEPACGEFCAQAGGFGAGEEPDVFPVEVPPQELQASEEGIVLVEATCNLDEACAGAIILSSVDREYGRADLEIPAGETEDVPVAVTDEALAALAESGEDPATVVTVPLADMDEPLSYSDPLTLLAPE